MSIPADPKSGQASPPGELALGAQQVPRHGETPQLPIAAAASTPGASLAGARVPGGPTLAGGSGLPELDPMALTRLVSELANELFAAPPVQAPTLADAEPMTSPPSAPLRGVGPPTAGPQAAPSPPSAGVLHGTPVELADPSPAAVPSAWPFGAASPSSPFGGAAAPSQSYATTHRGSAAPAAFEQRGATHAPNAELGKAGAAQVATERSSDAHTQPATVPYANAAPADAPYVTTASRTATSPSAPSTAQTSAPARSRPHDAAPRDPSDAHDVSSPFLAPLDLDALARLADPFGASPQSADPRSASPVPDVPGVPPAPVGLTFDTFEIVPTNDAALRSFGGTPFDANVLKAEFPILSEPVRGRRLVWLDNAATTQKPRAVIDRLSYFYEHENSNIHRAAHTLAARATDAYEAARETVRKFIHAPSAKDVVFVRGTTEGINLVAQSWGRRNVAAGDEIVITWLEHHANIVPWQMLCSEKGAKLRVAPVDDRGQVILEEYEKLLGPKTRLVSFTQVSNALGTITPAKEMIDMAHRHGALVLLDGAQSVSHMPVDVQLLGCDFFVFSGHKVFAPTGIGVVWGRSELLESMPPWQGGGNMIQDVTFERTLYQGAPARFEAGTGNIGDAVGLGAALEWLSRVGVERVERYEHELLEYGTRELRTVPGLTLIGTAPHKAGVLSFVLDGQKTEEVGGILDQDGIAVRSGHHCAQPILRRFGLEATVRASLAPYNTCEDIDALVAALRRLQAGHAATR